MVINSEGTKALSFSASELKIMGADGVVRELAGAPTSIHLQEKAGVILWE